MNGLIVTASRCLISLKGLNMLKKIGTIGLCAFINTTAYATADSLYDEEFPLVWSPIITLSAGPAWAAPGQNQYLYRNPPPNPDYYHYDSDMGILASGEIFFGLQRFFQPCMIGQLGIGVAGATDAKASGFVDVNGVVDANAFQYNINHGRAELKGKLINTLYPMAQPYVSASLGIGINNTHGYVPTTINQTLYPPYWFQTNTNVSFAYTVGLGVQTNLSRHWQVGIGYEFADWGRNYLKDDPQMTLYPMVTNGPSLTHLYTHELLFSLSYLF